MPYSRRWHCPPTLPSVAVYNGDTISEYGFEVGEHVDLVCGLEDADVDELLSQGISCKS